MRLTVVPGWGEGARQMAAVVKLLNDGGHSADYSRELSSRKKYGGIVAHSGGSYQYWSRIQADQLFLIAPPWHGQGRFSRTELARRAKLRRQDRADKPSLGQTLRFMSSLRSTWRHSRAVVSIDLLSELTSWLDKDRHRKIELIVYRGDTWTDREIESAFASLPRTRVTAIEGHHDDIRRQPAVLFKTIQHLIIK